MSIIIKWFPPSWFQIKTKDKIIYIDPAWLRTHFKKGNCVGYVITIEGKTIYHAGDTDFIPEMKELGKIDVALLPIGGKFTMDIEEAVHAAIAIKPKIVIPMHLHHLKADPQEFKDKVEARSDIKVAPLKIGEVYHLKC